jgi:ribosome-associated protein
MIDVTDTIRLDDADITFDFVRASGPGGQNVNKVTSAVQLRLDTHTDRLPDDVRIRLTELAGNRINKDGVLVIHSNRFRSQDRNRQEAIERLVVLIQTAAKEPKARKKTKPTAQSKQRRLEEKRRQSEKKKLRGDISYPD